MNKDKKISVNEMDKRRKEGVWKGEFDDNKVNLPLNTKIDANINKNFEERSLDGDDKRLNQFLSKASVWEELVHKYGYGIAMELWDKNTK